jgi:hypothetical protein
MFGGDSRKPTSVKSDDIGDLLGIGDSDNENDNFKSDAEPSSPAYVPSSNRRDTSSVTGVGSTGTRGGRSASEPFSSGISRSSSIGGRGKSTAAKMDLGFDDSDDDDIGGLLGIDDSDDEAEKKEREQEKEAQKRKAEKEAQEKRDAAEKQKRAREDEERKRKQELERKRKQELEREEEAAREREEQERRRRQEQEDTDRKQRQQADQERQQREAAADAEEAKQKKDAQEDATLAAAPVPAPRSSSVPESPSWLSSGAGSDVPAPAPAPVGRRGRRASISGGSPLGGLGRRASADPVMQAMIFGQAVQEGTGNSPSLVEHKPLQNLDSLFAPKEDREKELKEQQHREADEEAAQQQEEERAKRKAVEDAAQKEASSKATVAQTQEEREMEEMKERMRQQAELRKRMDLERQQQEQLQQQQATDAAMMAAAVSSPVRQPHTVATSSPLRLHPPTSPREGQDPYTHPGSPAAMATFPPPPIQTLNGGIAPPNAYGSGYPVPIPSPSHTVVHMQYAAPPTSAGQVTHLEETLKSVHTTHEAERRRLTQVPFGRIGVLHPSFITHHHSSILHHHFCTQFLHHHLTLPSRDTNRRWKSCAGNCVCRKKKTPSCGAN